MKPIMRHLAAFAAMAMAAPTFAQTAKWQVEADTSPLTNLAFVTASLVSEKPLTNMIGAPENARLILRCRDRVLSAYIAWPEVVGHDMTNFVGEPKTLVYWKLDDGAIANGLWAISDDGMAAGAFTTGAAAKLIASWRTARRLAVRMTGRTVQDVLFDLTGIDTAASQVLAACAVATEAAATSIGGTSLIFSAGVSTPATKSATLILADARRALEAKGFTIAAQDSSSLTTAPLEMNLTTKQADCGSALGLPYLIDRRARPTVAYRVVASDGAVVVQTAIGGIYKGAVGVGDRSLKCASKGMLEADLARQITASGAP